MDDDAIILFYSQYQAAENCTAGTIKERGIALRALLKRTDKTLLTLTRHDLIADLGREISPGRMLAPKTKQTVKSFYHTFFTWMQDEGFRLDNPGARLPRTRVPKTEPNPVTTADIEYLLASGIYGKTRMYVLLYAYQAFRAIEIAAVAGETIDYERRRILSKEGKGGKEVWRPIHPVVWEELKKFPRKGYLFPSPTGRGHVTRKNVSQVLSRALARAGIVGHRPHQLRAWHATELLDAGVDSIVAAASLRHSDMQSISKYILVKPELIREGHSRLPLVKVPDRSGRQRRAAA
jgi:integrase/recombinase XerD